LGFPIATVRTFNQSTSAKDEIARAVLFAADSKRGIAKHKKA